MLLSSIPDHLVVVVRVTCRLRVVVTNGRDVFVESSSSSIDARSKFSSYVKFLLRHFFCSSYYSTRWSPTTTKSGKAWLVGRPPKLFGLFFAETEKLFGLKIRRRRNCHQQRRNAEFRNEDSVAAKARIFFISKTEMAERSKDTWSHSWCEEENNTGCGGWNIR